MILLISLALAERLPNCDPGLPIAGSAGFTNGQEARRTNAATYSAANYYERLVQGRRSAGVMSLEWNATFNAATVPTWCSGDLSQDELNESMLGMFAGEDGFKESQRIYAQPLDLYSSNLVIAAGHPNFGGFYSASVTQSVLGMRAWVLPTLIIQMYPMVSAPLVGIWQRGDGLSSYSLDWVGGAWVDTDWFGARVGYTGVRGVYGSFDERVLGLFGSLGVTQEHNTTPWSFLKTGIDRVSPSNFGAKNLGKIVGASSLFLRDLPFGDVAADTSDGTTTTTTTTPLLPTGISMAGLFNPDPSDARLRTIHLKQHDIYEMVDVDITWAIAPAVAPFEGAVAWHTPGFRASRLVAIPGKGAQRQTEADDVGFLVKLGVVNLPARYDLGVEGGAFFSARAEYRMESPGAYVGFMLLFNDAEQLALYPFATNALTLNARIDFKVED